MEQLLGLGKKENLPQIDVINYQYMVNLLKNRTVIFNDVCDENIVEYVYLPLKQFENDGSDEPVTLIISSSGGSVLDSFFLADYIKSYKKPLKVVVLGYAFSMAIILLSAGSNNPNVTRQCFNHTYFLIHDGYTSIDVSESKTAMDAMNFNSQIDEEVDNFIIENSKISRDLYLSKTRKQWYFGAKEAKEYGLIDEIME